MEYSVRVLLAAARRRNAQKKSKSPPVDAISAIASIRKASQGDLLALENADLHSLIWALGHLGRPTPRHTKEDGVKIAIAQSDCRSLIRRIGPLLSWTSGRELCDIASAYSWAKVTDSVLFDRLLSGALSLSFNSIDFANLLRAFAKVQHQSYLLEELLQESHVNEVIRSSSALDVSRIVWSLGVLRKKSVAALARADGGFAPNAFDTQSLANVLWGAARLRQRISHILHLEMSQRTSLKYRELCAALWAVAETRDSESPLWQGCVVSSICKLGLPPPRATGILLWAHAKVLLPAPLPLAIDAHGVARRCYNAQSFANALWALSRMRMPLRSDDVSTALEMHRKFNAQEFSNVLWAIAYMNAPQNDFFVSVNVPPPRKMDEQHLSNILWAFASTSTRRRDVLETLGREILSRQNFELQALSNIFWAYSSVCAHSSRLEAHLRVLFHRQLESCNLKEDNVSTLLGFLWAGGSDHRIEHELREFGSRLDSVSPKLAHIPVNAFGERFDQPHIKLFAKGVVVLYKPPHWEVDSEGMNTSNGSKRLSSFLSRQADASSILSSREHGHGFIHRLDLPSSGLVLQASTYDGFYCLRIQRELGTMHRDYLVLCHGWVLSERSITARIRKRLDGRSEASIHGLPACTKLKVLSHVLREEVPLSLLAITILSGRTHQIRCHLQYIGHPVVCDHRYGTAEDASWCPRNFLHRYRLQFSDASGEVYSVSHGLPMDLREVLARLRVVSGDDAFDLWMQGFGAERTWSSWKSIGSLGRTARRLYDPLELRPIELQL